MCGYLGYWRTSEPFHTHTLRCSYMRSLRNECRRLSQGEQEVFMAVFHGKFPHHCNPQLRGTSRLYVITTTICLLVCPGLWHLCGGLCTEVCTWQLYAQEKQAAKTALATHKNERVGPKASGRFADATQSAAPSRASLRFDSFGLHLQT